MTCARPVSAAFGAVLILVAGLAHAEGIVPKRLIDELDKASPRPRPMVELSQACLAATRRKGAPVSAECRSVGPDLIGYKARRGREKIVYLSHRVAWSCEDCNTFELWLVRVETGNYERHFTVADKRWCGKAVRKPKLRGFVRQIWRYVDEYRGKGYRPLPSAITHELVDPNHVRRRTPLARLGGKANGAMLYVRRFEKRRRKRVGLFLVSPDNRREVLLAKFRRFPGKNGVFDVPRIRDAHLTPSGRHLIVNLELHDGVHCGASTHYIKVFPLTDVFP